MKKFLSWALAVALVASTLSPLSNVAGAVEVPTIPQRVTSNAAGEPLNGSSEGGQMSADGRYVLFYSSATNTGANDSNGTNDVFVKDMQTGSLIPISITSTGATGNDASGAYTISGNGRYVMFYSNASDLVAGDTNGYQDVFLRDIVAGTTRPLSGLSTPPSQQIRPRGNMSYDGRYAVLGSAQAGLIIRDLTTDTDKTFSGLYVQGATLSPDGQRLLFRSACGPGCAGPSPLEIMDIATGARETVSIMSDGSTSLDAGGGAMSDDSRYIAFLAGTEYADVYVRDRVTGVTTLESLATNGTHTQYQNESPCLSANGRVLTWTGNAQDVGSPVDNNVSLRRNLDTHTTIDVTDIPWGSNVGSFSTVCSDDGSRVVYSTGEYVPEDDAYNVNIFMATVIDDTAAPAISDVMWSANPVTVGQNTTLSATVTDNVQVKSARYSVDGAAPQAMTYNATTSKWEAAFGSSLAPGSYPVTMTATDTAGNVSAVSTTRLNVTGAGVSSIVTGANRQFTPSATNGDVLPGMTTSNQSAAATYSMTVGYGGTGLNANNAFTFTYNSGNALICLLFPTNANCHKFTITASSFSQMSLYGTNYSQGTFTGTASAVTDGVTTIHPFKVEVRDGNRVGTTTQDHFTLNVYPVGSDPYTASPLYHASADLSRTQITIQ